MLEQDLGEEGVRFGFRHALDSKVENGFGDLGWPVEVQRQPEAALRQWSVFQSADLD